MSLDSSKWIVRKIPPLLISTSSLVLRDPALKPVSSGTRPSTRLSLSNTSTASTGLEAAPSPSPSPLLALLLNKCHLLAPLPPTINRRAIPLKVLILPLHSTPPRLPRILTLSTKPLHLAILPTALCLPLMHTILTHIKALLLRPAPHLNLPPMTLMLHLKATINLLLLSRATILPTRRNKLILSMAALLLTPTRTLLNNSTVRLPLNNNTVDKDKVDKATTEDMDKEDLKADTSNSKERVVLPALATGSALLAKTTTSHGVPLASNALCLVLLRLPLLIAMSTVLLLDALNVILTRTPTLLTTGVAPSADLGTLASATSVTIAERPNLTAKAPMALYATLEAPIVLDPIKELVKCLCVELF